MSMPHVLQRRASAICALLEGLLTCHSCIKQTQFPDWAKQKKSKKKKVDSALLWSDLEQIFYYDLSLTDFTFIADLIYPKCFFVCLFVCFFKSPILRFSQCVG